MCSVIALWGVVALNAALTLMKMRFYKDMQFTFQARFLVYQLFERCGVLMFDIPISLYN